MHYVVVGLGPNKTDALKYCGAPGYKVVGLPWDGDSQRYDYWVEMHDRSLWERRGEQYIKRLQESTIPIYMQEVYEDIPMSRKFPFHCMPSSFYYNSSPAYMLALCLQHCASGVEIFGVNLRDEEEYAYQRPNIEYIMGYLEGKLCRVNVHGDSSLKEFYPNILFNGEMQCYNEKYGYLE